MGLVKEIYNEFDCEWDTGIGSDDETTVTEKINLSADLKLWRLLECTKISLNMDPLNTANMFDWIRRFLSSGRCLLSAGPPTRDSLCDIGFSENFRRNFRFHSRSRRRSVPTPSHLDPDTSHGYPSRCHNKRNPKIQTILRSDKSTFNLSSLPPTQDTARFHTFRVYHQVQSWLVCFHCSGETCSNVMELSELINENDFDDDPPTLTPLPSPVLSLVFNSETRSDAEPLPGPSKRLRTE
ncbi:hypothetical protein EVAR_100254_1 [Eumeta japonica]|uniref:Uncharacterized protein n=1 Tax=Eumeta variegata TaxID=151549 RepID=A0A4C2ADJ0_EUMVA|nr:hypothetical protein EVAR_100254_1 [Eumeta japonica]